MLAVSLKWRLGVVRRRPKGTERSGRGPGRIAGQILLPAQGLGGRTWVWVEGRVRGPGGDLRPGLPSLPCLFLFHLDPMSSGAFWVSLPYSLCLSLSNSLSFCLSLPLLLFLLSVHSLPLSPHPHPHPHPGLSHGLSLCVSPSLPLYFSVPQSPSSTPHMACP